jgi:hypothetical protein
MNPSAVHLYEFVGTLGAALDLIFLWNSHEPERMWVPLGACSAYESGETGSHCIK